MSIAYLHQIHFHFANSFLKTDEGIDNMEGSVKCTVCCSRMLRWPDYGREDGLGWYYYYSIGTTTTTEAVGDERERELTASSLLSGSRTLLCLRVVL